MTRTSAIHQFVASLEEHDAVGNHAMAIRGLLRGNGFESEIFVWHSSKSMRNQCRIYREYPSFSSPENAIIYHFSVGSPLTSFFLQAPGKKIMIYHNITPARFFAGINNLVYRVVKDGRRELRSIAGRVDLAIAVSGYNRRELVEAGFDNTHTVPLLLDFGLYNAGPDQAIIDRYAGGKTNIIFVGRISPNKKQEDVIRAFSVYKKYVNANSRLFIIGQHAQVPEYKAILDDLVKTLDVEDVHFTGSVPQEQLNAYYSVADVFLCMSEHEGFCIPLVECMSFGVPVLAFDSSAVTSTLNGTGILFDQKDLGRVAEMIHLVAEKGTWRDSIIKKQRTRLEDFRPDKVEKQFMGVLNGSLN